MALLMNWIVTTLAEDEYTFTIPLSSENDNDTDPKSKLLYNLDQTSAKFLTDFHYIIGYERIDKLSDSDNEPFNKYQRLAFLNEIDQLNTNLIFVKQVFFLEVNAGLSNIAKLYDHSTDVDYEIELLTLFRHLLFHGVQDLESWNPLYELPYISKSSKTNFVDKMTKFWRYGLQKRAEIIYKFLNSVRKWYESVTIEKIWLSSFLLLFIPPFVDDVGDIPRLLELNDTEEIHYIVLKETNIFNQASEEQQRIYQNQMLHYYHINSYPHTNTDSDHYYSNLYEILKNHGLKRHYDGPGCFGTMDLEGTMYATISGGPRFNYQIFENALKGSSYQKVTFNNQIRYYYTPTGFITFDMIGSIETQLRNIYTKEKKCILDRMFSCCERKLLTVLYDKPDPHYQMYIRKKPCFMCERALNHFETKRGNASIITYPESTLLEYEKINTLKAYDSITEYILRELRLKDLRLYVPLSQSKP